MDMTPEEKIDKTIAVARDYLMNLCRASAIRFVLVMTTNDGEDVLVAVQSTVPSSMMGSVLRLAELRSEEVPDEVMPFKDEVR